MRETLHVRLHHMYNEPFLWWRLNIEPPHQITVGIAVSIDTTPSTTDVWPHPAASAYSSEPHRPALLPWSAP